MLFHKFTVFCFVLVEPVLALATQKSSAISILTPLLLLTVIIVILYPISASLQNIFLHIVEFYLFFSQEIDIVILFRVWLIHLFSLEILYRLSVQINLWLLLDHRNILLFAADLQIIVMVIMLISFFATNFFPQADPDLIQLLPLTFKQIINFVDISLCHPPPVFLLIFWLFLHLLNLSGIICLKIGLFYHGID